MTDQQPTEQVLRPDPELYKKWLGGSLAGMVAGATSPIAILLWMAVLHPQNFIAIIIATVATIVVAYPVAMLIVRSPKARVVIKADQIDFYGVLGRKRVLPLSDPIEGLLSNFHAADTFISFDFSGTSILLMRDKKTGKRFRLRGSNWPINDMLKVAEAAKVEIRQFSKQQVALIEKLEKKAPTSSTNDAILEDSHTAEIQKKYPGLLRFAEVHPNTFSLIIIGAFCLAMLIIFLFTSQSQPL